MATYALFARDATGARVVEVDDFAQLDLTLRFNGVGDWTLDLFPGTRAAQALVPGAGLVVERDGAVFFSGPVRTARRSWSADGSVLTVGGPDDAVVLRDRLALPVPSGPPYAAAEHDVRSGPASTVLLAYVDANAGPGATPPRRVPGLVLGPDPVIGATVTGRARFQTLVDLLADLAVAGGDVGFRVLQTGAVRTFSVYQPVDRTASAVLSPLQGTLRAFTYAIDPPEFNYVVVGGGGEGTARTFVEQGDSANALVFGRIESFRDRRDTTDAAEMAQTAAQELAEKATRTALSTTPLDAAGVAFGVDYGLGDRVTVVLTRETTDGASSPRDLAVLETVRDVVRAVRVRLTPDGGEEVVPMVGGPDAADPTARGAVLNILATTRALAERVGRLERVP